jgi:uncharacterized protein
MKHFLFKLIPPRTTFPSDASPEEMAAMREHVAYWTGKMQDGAVLAFGPVGDPAGTYGIGILQLADDQDPTALCAKDPVIRAGLGFQFECHPMPRLVVRSAGS